MLKIKVKLSILKVRGGGDGINAKDDWMVCMVVFL